MVAVKDLLLLDQTWICPLLLVDLLPASHLPQRYLMMAYGLLLSMRRCLPLQLLGTLPLQLQLLGTLPLHLALVLTLIQPYAFESFETIDPLLCFYPNFMLRDRVSRYKLFFPDLNDAIFIKATFLVPFLRDVNLT